MIPAQATWDGAAPVGHDDPIVDQLIAPEVANRCRTVFACGPIVWALAAPTAKSLAALNADTDASEARDHPCPPTPESQDPTKIGGEAASLSAKHCPMDGGLLVLRAIAIHERSGLSNGVSNTNSMRSLRVTVRMGFGGRSGRR